MLIIYITNKISFKKTANHIKDTIDKPIMRKLNVFLFFSPMKKLNNPIIIKFIMMKTIEMIVLFI